MAAGPDGGPGADVDAGGTMPDTGLDGGPMPDGGPGSDGGADAGDGGDMGPPPDMGPDPRNPNNRSMDSDCDGLSDQEEFANRYPGGLQTLVDDPDSDGDGLPDGLELGRTAAVPGSGCTFQGDADPSTRTSPVRADTDSDGLSDGLEDANHNGRVDSGETNPLSNDSDSDGLPDGLEDANRNGQLDPGETNPTARDTDNDGIADGVEDRNRDGQRDSDELDPTSADTDGEGLDDGAEDANFNGLRERFETDGTSPDTDCDGLDDAAELSGTPPTSPVNPDTDNDGLSDGLELGVTAAVPGANCPPMTFDADPSTTTDPTNRDSDNDGLDDGEEDANGNGRQDGNETDPEDEDTDNDTISDGDEVRAGFDPLDPMSPGSATGITDICSDANLKVVDFDVATGAWTVATERSTNYQAIATSGGSGVTVAALDDATNGVAGFVIEMPLLSGAGTIPAQVSALESRVTAGVGAEGLTHAARSSARNIQSHDGYAAAVGGLVDISAGANRNAAAIRNSMLRLVSNLPANAFSGLPTNTGSGARDYVYGYEVLLRTNPNRLVVVGAVVQRTVFDDPSDRRGIVISDLVNGTSLAQADAARDKDCDPFVAQGQAIADFIWMADVSGSTDDDRGNISSAAQVIFQALRTNNVDFRMGVVPHHENHHRFAGAGGNLRGSGFTTVESTFIANLQDTSGQDGSEFGLTAASDAIRRALPRTAPGQVNARKFRDEATVAVVYISDEFADEVQENGAYGYTPVCSTNIRDYYSGNVDSVCAAAPTQACVDRIVQPFITELGNVGGVAFAQVIAPNAQPTNCTGYGCGTQFANEPGRGYIEVVNATGGTFFSPCSANPGNALRPIIDAVTGAASQFQLSGAPISSTIRVGVVRNNAVTVVPRDKQDGFDYDAASNSIFFRGTNYRPAQGEQVVVSYRLWEPAPPACPAGQVFDTTLGICVCDMAACNQNCGPNEVCDSNCACACAADCNGNCGAGEVCNPATCACECASDCGGCPDGTVCNPTSCACECTGDCGGACAGTNTTCNQGTCACECQDCGGACGGNTECNDSLCECECPSDCSESCDGFAECDLAQGCNCVCPTDCGGNCVGDAVCDSTSCACACPAGCDDACPGNQVCNPENGCACECPADCGGCGAAERCDVASCQCVPAF